VSCWLFLEWQLTPQPPHLWPICRQDTHISWLTGSVEQITCNVMWHVRRLTHFHLSKGRSFCIHQLRKLFYPPSSHIQLRMEWGKLRGKSIEPRERSGERIRWKTVGKGDARRLPLLVRQPQFILDLHCICPYVRLVCLAIPRGRSEEPGARSQEPGSRS